MPRVQQKRGTAANLASVDPTPLAGELIVVTDENTLVIGNGSDSYTSLSYVTATPRSHTHPLSDISGLTGTPSASTFLRGDGAWATPEGGGGGGGSDSLHPFLLGGM